jgi:hypothetical protein
MSSALGVFPLETISNLNIPFCVIKIHDYKTTEIEKLLREGTSPFLLKEELSRTVTNS